jgi:hypothetical protein
MKALVLLALASIISAQGPSCAVSDLIIPNFGDAQK